MSGRVCTVDGCDRKYESRGLCNMHYIRLRKKGLTGNAEPLKYRHGGSTNAGYHPLYKTWTNMRYRCNDPKHPRYFNYGGRGITVCDRWDNFANFVTDMGERPEGMSLDRIDNEKGYSPENCRWADRSTQNKNRRPMRRLSYVR